MGSLIREEGPRDSGVRRLRAVGATAIAVVLDNGGEWTLPWGPVTGTHGRVFVSKFRSRVCGPMVVEVSVDRRTVWSSRFYRNGNGGVESGWVDPAEAEAAYAARREYNRSAAARRAADRETILAAISSGFPVRHWDGQEGGYFYLPVPEGVEADVTASALGCFRALVGAQNWDWKDFYGWVREVTNPPTSAPRVGRREALDPVVFDMLLAG
jgi:hypothetical protein